MVPQKEQIYNFTSSDPHHDISIMFNLLFSCIAMVMVVGFVVWDVAFLGPRVEIFFNVKEFAGSPVGIQKCYPVARTWLCICG